MQIIQLNVDDEVKSLGDALTSLISDIKAKKSVGVIAADALPSLISAVGGYANMGADLKKVDNQTYLLRALGLALEPAV